MSTGLVLMILAGCVALIGAVYAVYKRATKVENPTPDTAKQ